MTITLPITLTIAAGAALINIWLGTRVSRLRVRDKVSVGDAGTAGDAVSAGGEARA